MDNQWKGLEMAELRRPKGPRQTKNIYLEPKLVIQLECYAFHTGRSQSLIIQELLVKHFAELLNDKEGSKAFEELVKLKMEQQGVS